jgi:hypothetical protein
MDHQFSPWLLISTLRWPILVLGKRIGDMEVKHSSPRLDVQVLIMYEAQLVVRDFLGVTWGENSQRHCRESKPGHLDFSSWCYLLNYDDLF